MNSMISIIIVNWNGQKWLQRCLDALLAQTYPNIEIIVVDNNSQDNSVKLLYENYSQVKVVRNKANVGFSSGNNVGISAANGEYILLLNNDTWLQPDALALLIEEKVRRKLDVIGPREADYYTGSTRPPYASLIDPLGHPVYLSLTTRESFFLTGVCLLFKKDLYEETGGLDNNFFMYVEEVDWFWRLRLLQKTFAYSDEVNVYHAMGGSTKRRGLNEKTFLWRNQNTLQMLLKNYQFTTLVLILPLYFLQNILEILVFLILFKPQIAQTYIQGWVYNVKSINKIMENRTLVKHNRRIDDKALLTKMYLGPAKIKHIISVINHEKDPS